MYIKLPQTIYLENEFFFELLFDLSFFYDFMEDREREKNQTKKLLNGR